LKFSDQNVLEVKFCELFGEWVKKGLVKNVKGGAMKLCRPRFRSFFTRDRIVSRTLQADTEEEFLERNVTVRSSLVC
jgi:hypothetical protein